MAAWSEQVFAYCERGLDPGVWAEPLNAASNAMFFVAAAAGFQAWRERPAGQRGTIEFVLVALVFAIAVGSTLFHTLATRWAAVADTVPIGIFMVAYLAYALGCFARLSWGALAGGMAVFIVSLPAASMIRCTGGPCLNGSLAYGPALLALILVGLVLARLGHPAARAVLVGGAVFALSLAARTLDRAVCPYTIIAARAAGTHFLWHLLNGLLLLILLRAAMHHGRDRLAEPARAV